MIVLEVIAPGDRLALADLDLARRVERILDGIEAEFIHATMALNWFLDAQSRANARVAALVASPDSSGDRRAAWDAEVFAEIERIQGAKSMPIGEDLRYDDQTELEAEIVVAQRRWAGGEPADRFRHAEMFVHARTFVLAVEMFIRLLRVLARTVNIPNARIEHKSLLAAIPGVKDVRDSIAHIEDRRRGLDRDGQPLRLKGKPLGLSNLTGDRLGYTVSSGEYVEIAVSVDTLMILRDSLHRMVRRFPWNDRPRMIPAARPRDF